MRYADQGAGVVDEVAGGEVVGAVHHEVVAAKELKGVARVEAKLVLDHLDVRVDRAHALGRRPDLGPADVGLAVDDLALEVGLLDDVGVHHPQGADARGREVEEGRGPQPPGSHDQDAGVGEAPLPLAAHLRQQQVARVALDLRGGQLGPDVDERWSCHAATIPRTGCEAAGVEPSE